MAEWARTGCKRHPHAALNVVPEGEMVVLPGEDSFREWAQNRRESLRRTAFLLSGDWYLADDLVQDCLVKVYARWHRIEALDNADGYVRKVLVNVFFDHVRRPARREMTVEVVPDRLDHAHDALDYRDQLIAALRDVPPGQRAVLVLRYWEDLSVEQTAAALGKSVGNVKSQSSRGLAALRTAFNARGLEVPREARTEIR